MCSAAASAAAVVCAYTDTHARGAVCTYCTEGAATTRKNVRVLPTRKGGPFRGLSLLKICRFATLV